MIAARVESAYVRLVLASLLESRRASDGEALVRLPKCSHGAPRSAEDASSAERRGAPCEPTHRRLAHLLRDVAQATGPREALARVLRYLLAVAPATDPQPFLQAIADEVGDTTKDDAMGLLDVLMEKSRAEGEAKGKAEGKAEGEARGQLVARRRTIEKLLQLKFGSLSDDTRQRIAAMDDAALDAAIERVLDAQRIDDVVG